MGPQVLPLARATQERLHGALPLAEAQRARLDTPLTGALAAPRQSAHPSRRLPQGQALPPCQIVNADDPTRAPIGTGKRLDSPYKVANFFFQD
jgi:hypothetical protein